MATAESKENLCLVCLEAPAVRKVDTCQHSYCENCVSPSNFTCPQCVTEGTEDQRGLPPDDHGKEAITTGAISSESVAMDNEKKRLVNSNCKLCQFKGDAVKATNVCKECKMRPLCVSCSDAHQTNKATKRHIITSLASVTEKEDVICDIHGELADFFCRSCIKSVCPMCTSLNHADHDVDTFNNVVLADTDEIRIGMEHHKEWLDVLKSDEKILQESRATAQEMEDVLIKSIEDHAEKCIEEILKNKEALQKQVRADFEVVRVMEKRLEAMPELQRVSGDNVAEAESLLNEQAELHSTYIEKLVALKHQLDKLKEDHCAYEENKAKFQQTFRELCEKAITFYPRMPNCNIGGFKYTGRRCDAGGSCVCDTCQQKVTKLPDRARVVECRQRGTCTCGTCGCVFDRNRLKSDGSCNGVSSLCSGQPKQCSYCKLGFGSHCITRTSCNVKFAVRNYIP